MKGRRGPLLSNHSGVDYNSFQDLYLTSERTDINKYDMVSAPKRIDFKLI